MVHEDSSVEWSSVWIIGDETFAQDLDQLVLGGPGLSASDSPTPHVPRPGWFHSVTMLDAGPGRTLLTLIF